MANVYSTLAGGVSGATVAAGSGGSADGSTPWDAVSVGNVLTYSSTHSPFAGGMSITGQSTATASLNDVAWSSSMPVSSGQLWASVMLYVPSTPGANWSFMTFTNASGIMCSLAVTSGLKLGLRNTSSTLTTTGGVSIPLNTWIRAEMRLIVASSTAGQYELRTFVTNPFGSTPDETITSTAAQNTLNTTAPTGMRIGVPSVSAASIGPLFLGYPQVNNAQYPPAPLSPPPNATNMSGFQAAVRRAALY